MYKINILITGRTVASVKYNSKKGFKFKINADEPNQTKAVLTLIKIP
jgi:hypothetical protein